MKATSAPRIAPLMAGFPGTPSGLSSTALGALATAPPPLSRTLGRLGTGSWMRLALERSSALISGDEKLASVDPPASQQVGSHQHESPAQPVAAERQDPPTILGEGPDRPASSLDQRSRPLKGKRGRVGGVEAASFEPDLEHQGTEGEPNESAGGAQRPRRQAPPTGKKHNKKRRRNLEEVAEHAGGTHKGSRGNSPATAACAADPKVVALGKERQQEEQMEAADALASIKYDVDLRTGHVQAPEQVVPPQKYRISTKGLQSVTRSQRIPSEMESDATYTEVQQRLTDEGPSQNIPGGKSPSAGGPSTRAPGDFSFVVGLIGGLAVPAAVDSATGSPEDDQEKERQHAEARHEKRRKGHKATRRKHDEESSHPTQGHPTRGSLRTSSNSTGTASAQQQSQQSGQQEDVADCKRRSERRQRRRTIERRHRRPEVAFSPQRLPQLSHSSSGKGPQEKSILSVTSACPTSPPGPSCASVGIQADAASCPFFPSLWTGDFAAASERAHNEEKRKLMRLLGSSEGGASPQAPDHAPQNEKAAKCPVGDPLDEEGTSSSSDSPASPARSSQRHFQGAPVFKPRYVSFGGSVSCTLFAAGGAAEAQKERDADASMALGSGLLASPAQWNPSGDSARLMRALRRTHRRLILGGQSAVLRSDSSSEEESSREPSPCPSVEAQDPAASDAPHVQASPATLVETATASSDQRAKANEGDSVDPTSSRKIHLQEDPVLQDTAAATAASVTLPPAASVVLPPTTAPPPSLGVASGRSRQPRSSAPPAFGSHLNSWRLSNNGSDSDGEAGAKPLQLDGNNISNDSGTTNSNNAVVAAGAPLSRQGPLKHQITGPMEAAGTPVAQHFSCAAAAEAMADASTPLIVEAPAVSGRWEPPQISVALQNEQQEKHKTLIPSASAATEELVLETPNGHSNVVSAIDQLDAVAMARHPRDSPPINLLSSPRKERSSEAEPIGSLSLEGSPMGTSREEATEVKGRHQDVSINCSNRYEGSLEAPKDCRISQEAQGPCEEPHEESLLKKWEGVDVEGDEIVLSDGRNPEDAEWMASPSRSAHASPLVVSVPDSEVEVASPLSLMLEEQLQHQAAVRDAAADTNENLPRQQQQQNSRGNTTIFEEAEDKAQTLFATAPAEAGKPGLSALWFRNLGEIGLDEHRPATEPRVSRCGSLTPGKGQSVYGGF
ncbi:uncharacterized protein LOC34622746 [Cyclospora cayetanensis]|uniref:Uncharacterized protein LOC34622746 n=1 Tax=Cyclospora cayetanensis TaxID=88456 RepID=A0A6P6S248_9EIME|nr:uncharacterized protein LOC34622746 [Cyclospora cayetanensis]